MRISRSGLPGGADERVPAERHSVSPREIELPIRYKGNLLAEKSKPDFICYDTIIVELKALDRLGGKEKAQVINYLKATGLERGLLLNFGTTRLEYERLILTARYSSADYTDNADQKEHRRPERSEQKERE